jgi:pyrroloquinoline quinone biosynthesis protein B
MKRRTFLHSCWGAAAGVRMKHLLHGQEPLLSQPENKSDLDGEVLVKVLGTAQDGGIPHIGCWCPNCRRAWNEPKSSRLIVSLAVCDLLHNKTFLVDATPDIRKQTRMIWKRMKQRKGQKKFSPDGILLTHAHIGHYTGLMFYGYEAQSTTNLPVYCSNRMTRFLSHNGPWEQLIRLKNIEIHSIEPDQSISLTSGISVEGFQVPHREEYSDTLGFKIYGKQKSLLYIPDIHKWEKWHRSAIDEVRKADIALIDGTFYSPTELPSRDLTSIGHPFITHSVELLKDVVATGKKQVFFIHLNHSNQALDPGSEEQKALLRQGFALASDGMEFCL